MMNVAKPFLFACNEPTACFPKILTPHSHPKIAAAAITLNNRKRVLGLRCKSLSLSLNGDLLEVHKEIDSEEQFIVVNFYRFVFIEDPEAEVSKHLSFMEVISYTCALSSHMLILKISFCLCNLKSLKVVCFYAKIKI